MNLVDGCRIKPKLCPEPPMESARDRLRCFDAVAGVSQIQSSFPNVPGAFATFGHPQVEL